VPLAFPPPAGGLNNIFSAEIAVHHRSVMSTNKVRHSPAANYYFPDRRLKFYDSQFILHTLFVIHAEMFLYLY
jgi:hypothetical protein